MLNVWALSTRVESVIGVLLLTALSSIRADNTTQGDVESRGVILNALTLGAGALSINTSIDGCIWRKEQVVSSASTSGGSGGSGSSGEGDPCPDPDVKFYLYTSLGSPRREIDARNSASALASALASAGWVQHYHTAVIIHGYGGGDNTIPIAILRDAYLSRGDVNVIMVDWSALSPPPCYPAAVHNAAHVGRCAAVIPKMLRDAGAGTDAWSCVGHSLGAHICGVMSEYLSFRVHKIIGLDPARPLVRPSLRFRLDPSDAAVVHVIHTDAGHYGESGRLGTADFCVNGGRTQPHCRFSPKGEHLCNHISAVCVFAESLDPNASLIAEPCSRRCLAVRLRPGVDREMVHQGGPIHMGPYSPDSASGTYCMNSLHQPYCPRKSSDRGHPKCCIGGVANLDDNRVGTIPEAEPSDAPGVLLHDPNEPSPTAETTTAAPTSSSDLNVTRSLFAAESPIPTERMDAEPTVAMSRVSDDNGVVLVLPSTEIDLPSSTTISPVEQEPVFPVYSTVAGTVADTGPVLVVMATPVRNSSHGYDAVDVLTEIKTRKSPRPFIPHFSPSPNSLDPFPTSMNKLHTSRNPFQTPPNSFSSSPITRPMFPVESSMTEMLPPKPNQSLPPTNPVSMAFPAEMPLSLPAGGMDIPGELTMPGMPLAVPMSPPPPNGGIPIPGAPDDGDVPIPMAGSLTGPWVPMVMLPPTPFSTDSWKVRSSSKIPPVRRSTYRNYIYE